MYYRETSAARTELAQGTEAKVRTQKFPQSTAAARPEPARGAAALIVRCCLKISSICLLMESSQERMASSVCCHSSSSVSPHNSAPRSMTSREQPAANFLSLYFFFRLLSSMSCTLLDGRMSARRTDQPGQLIGCISVAFPSRAPALISTQIAQPWLHTA